MLILNLHLIDDGIQINAFYVKKISPVFYIQLKGIINLLAIKLIQLIALDL